MTLTWSISILLLLLAHGHSNSGLNARKRTKVGFFFPYAFWSFNMYYHQRGVGQQDILRYFIYLFMDAFFGDASKGVSFLGGPGIHMPLIPNKSRHQNRMGLGGNGIFGWVGL